MPDKYTFPIVRLQERPDAVVMDSTPFQGKRATLDEARAVALRLQNDAWGRLDGLLVESQRGDVPEFDIGSSIIDEPV